MPWLSWVHTRTSTSRVVSSTSPHSPQLARIVAINRLSRAPVQPPSIGACDRRLEQNSEDRPATLGWLSGQYGRVPTRLPSLVRAARSAFAHRGARAHAPENTIEAFALALRLGATGLESDVWLTADGEAVLDHDGSVGRSASDRSGRSTEPICPRTSPRWRSCSRRCGTDVRAVPRRQGSCRRRRGSPKWSAPPGPIRRSGSGCATTMRPARVLAGTCAGHPPGRLHPDAERQAGAGAPRRDAAGGADRRGQPALLGMVRRPDHAVPPVRRPRLRMGRPARHGSSTNCSTSASTPSTATTPIA